METIGVFTVNDTMANGLGEEPRRTRNLAEARPRVSAETPNSKGTTPNHPKTLNP